MAAEGIDEPLILSTFALSLPQRAAATARGGDVAVTAGAGTGKTRTLVARYLILLAEAIPLRNIVAVTFTRKAAREMRNRVREEIGLLLNQDALPLGERETWQDHYQALDAARIGTIHNLCAEILRTHPAEIGVDPKFGVLDETQAALLIHEAADSALAWAMDSEEPTTLFELLAENKLRELIVLMLTQRLTTVAFSEAVPADAVYDRWQARLESLQEEAIERLMADRAFTAARECLSRNQASVQDDKRETQRQLALAALANLDNESLAGKLRNLAALKDLSLAGGSQKNWPGGKSQLEEVKEALRQLRDAYGAEPCLGLRLNEQDVAIARVLPALFGLFNQASTNYAQLKAQRESLDFDDLEAGAIGLLERDDAVRSYWQSQVQALLVDEFQDTNQRQCRFIRLLCPDAGKLFVVGDAKQSIYRFRGADVAVFAAEKARIAQQAGELIDLDTSFRTHAALLTGMNELLRPVLGEPSPTLPSYVAPFAPLQAHQASAGHGLQPPFLEFHLALGTKPNALPLAAAALAQRLRELSDRYQLDYGDMAVLCRATSSFHFYEDAFDQARIPYLTVAGKGFLERPEIRDLLNALRAVADPHDDVAIAGLLRSPACGLSDESLYWLSQQREEENTLWDTLQRPLTLPDSQQAGYLQTAVALIRTLNRQAGRARAADLLKQFLDQTNYCAILRRAGQTRALRNVAKLLEDVHKSELVNVSDFLDYARTLRESGAREGEARATTGGAVQIMTIHAAKGLEFPVVVLGDAGKGMPPARQLAVDQDLGILLGAKHADDVQAASFKMWQMIEEAQNAAETGRMLYVALTRAEQMILVNGYARLSSAGKITYGGWLDELAAVTGLQEADLSAYDKEGDAGHAFPLNFGETSGQAIIYEPFFAPTQGTSKDEGPAVPATSAVGLALREPLQPPAADLSASETRQRIWRIIPEKHNVGAPPWLIGRLVHEALAAWHFPGMDFEAWIVAHSQNYGLADPRSLQNAQTETVRLLNQFKRHAIYEAINGADEKRHELPYSYLVEGKTVSGYIDLLYRRGADWTLIDFKTDRLRDEAQLRSLMVSTDYQQQIMGYGRAVQQLMGVRPRLTLCFLDFDWGVRLEEVLAVTPASQKHEDGPDEQDN